MKTKKAIFFLLVFLSYVPVLAQVDTAWVRIYNGTGNTSEDASLIAIDDSGNVYVSGSSVDSADSYAYLTIKYTTNGDTVWSRLFHAPGVGIRPYGLAVDKSGNAYVTGYVGFMPQLNYATIKYAPNGDTMWIRYYDGPGNFINSIDVATGLAVDDSENVYVTGYSTDTATLGSDYATIKYSPNGDVVWVRRYNASVNRSDFATGLVLDKTGSLYVSGYSGYGPYDYLTVKYTSMGDTVWSKRYAGPGNGDDVPTSMAVDKSGNVYVTGYSLGNGTFDDWATLKYMPDGDTVWVRRHMGPGNSTDRPSALAVDDSGNVYVTGIGTSGGHDFVTIKYAENGDTLWLRRYNGPSNGIDVPFSIAVDDTGDAYVTGSSSGVATLMDFATIKYSPQGDTLWVKRYNGPENKDDGVGALVLDKNKNLFVTGGSFNGTNSDLVTMKYVQFACSAKPGDVTGDDKVLLPDIVAIINFLFKSQPAPNPLCRADANADGTVLLTDIVYLINSIFRSGPAPQKSRECCL